MKLLIKGNKNGVTVESDGNTEEVIPAALLGLHKLMCEKAESKKDFEHIKTSIRKSLKRMNYDGTLDMSGIGEGREE